MHHGYKYRKDRINADGRPSWRCTRPNCSRRIKVSEVADIMVVTKHNHAPDPNKITATKIVAKIRERAIITAENPRQFIQRSTAAVFLEVANLLPEYNASQRAIERKLKRNFLPYGPVNSTADIFLPDQHLSTIRNEPFLLWDSHD